MKIIDDLVIEITRECNANCAHCLRGDAQNISLTNEVIDNISNQLKDYAIRNLTLSGGEPLLKPEIIDYLLAKFKENNISISTGALITNGLLVERDQLNSIINFIIQTDYPEEFYLALSEDNFHPIPPYKNKQKLEVFSAFKTKPLNSLIRSGRSTKGRLSVDDKISVYNDDDDIIIAGIIYINSFGNFLNGCDCSYNFQDYCDTFTFNELLMSFNIVPPKD